MKERDWERDGGENPMFGWPYSILGEMRNEEGHYL